MFRRHTHPSRSLVAAVLAAALVIGVPTVAPAAGQSAALERTRRQIAEIKKRIAEAKGREAVIKGEVKALDRQIGDLNKQIRDGQHDISELESGIRTASSQITELENKYKKATEASNERARRLYKSGPAETLGRLISSKSILEFARLQIFWERSSEMDGKTMIDAARLKSELSERKDDLGHIKTDLSAQRKWVQARLDLAAEARSDRSVALQAVQNQIKKDEDHVAGLEEDSKRLTEALKSGGVSRSDGKEPPKASKGGFAWPVPGKVTSPYGPRRGGFHSGLDIDGSTGDAIRAAKAGTVAGVGCGGGYGICTIIDHGGGVTTLYAHQSRKAVGGGSVERGQVIGYVGCTGSCSGSHLHFEVRINGAPRNPRSYL